MTETTCPLGLRPAVGERRLQEAGDGVPVIAPVHDAARQGGGFGPHDRAADWLPGGQVQEPVQERRVGDRAQPGRRAPVMLGNAGACHGDHAYPEQAHRPDGDAACQARPVRQARHQAAPRLRRASGLLSWRYRSRPQPKPRRFALASRTLISRRALARRDWPIRRLLYRVPHPRPTGPARATPWRTARARSTPQGAGTRHSSMMSPSNSPAHDPARRLHAGHNASAPG